MRTFRLSLAALLTALALAPVASADLLSPDKAIPDVVDHYLEARLREEKVTPAPQADDANLFRRLTLDLVGRTPTAAELKAYLESKEADKRLKAVERLMASSGYVRHQAEELDVLLMGGAPGRGSLRGYLLGAVKENKPWDAIFRELLMPDESDPKQRGTSAFIKSRARDVDRLTNDVSVVFFGVNISCAQCHDHPLVEDWKQDHFYGMKAFFVPTFESGPFVGEREPATVAFRTTKGLNKQARMMFLTGKAIDVPAGKALSPAELKKQRAKDRMKKGAAPPPPPKVSSRAKLAEVALQPGQRDFFARAIVNRTWHRLFGYGLVNPTDQLHSANAPSHPELLDWLARDLVAHNYDLRRLTRGLVLSKAYSRSSRWAGERWPRPNLFAVARLRPLTPAQLAASLRIATTSPDQFGAALKADEFERRIESLENSARGLASLFEQPRDDFQIGVAEALLFSNSDRIQREVLADGGDRLVGKLKDIRDTDLLVDTAVRNVLSRPATAEEKKLLGDYVRARADRPAEAARQLVWALLSSSEFRFNY
jgi:hypothetical protein